MIRKSIFHEDWWLDALAPGQWREVTYNRGDHIAGRLRFVERSAGGMTVCEMPQITRFLGPIVTAPSGKTATRIRSAYSIIMELLKQLAAHDHVEMTLDTEFSDLAPFLAAGYEVKVHPTFILDCQRPIEELWAGLRDKTKNVIRRARDHLAVCGVDDVDQFVNFYRNNLDGAEPHFDMSLLPAAYAAANARQRCKIFGATDSSGTMHAQVFFIWDDKYVYYFLSTRDKGVAHLGAVSLLLWTGIELANSRGLYFDFDGGITDDIKYKFKSAFGGKLANRFDVVRSTVRYRLQRAIRKIPRAIVRLIFARAKGHSSQPKTSEIRIGIKATFKRFTASIARLSGWSRVLRVPAVSAILKELPGTRHLLPDSARSASWDRVHPFDLAYGADTSGFVPVEELAQLENETARAHALPYAGSQPSIVRTVLGALAPLDSFAFVDLGCGKGRPLLVASELSFRAIVGVELSAQLVEIARHNADLIAKRFPERTPIRIVAKDATQFPLPDGNLVIFLYNPFDGEVIAKFVEAINTALINAQRTVYIVYYNPIAGHHFDASPLLRRYFAGTLPYAADELGYGPDTEDPVVVWQGGTLIAPTKPGADGQIEIIDAQCRVRLVPR